MARRLDFLSRNGVRLALILGGLLLFLIIVLPFFLPWILERLILESLESTSVKGAKVDISSVGPFSLHLNRLHTTLPAIDAEVLSAQADYTPLELLRDRSIDSLVVDGLSVTVDLDQLEIPTGDGGPPTLFPEFLEQAPIQRILQEEGLLTLRSGQETQELLFESLYDKSADGSVFAAVSIDPIERDPSQAEDGAFLSLSGNDGEGEASLDFLLSRPLRWLALFGPLINLPELKEGFLSLGPASGDLNAKIHQRLVNGWDASIDLEHLATSPQGARPGVRMEGLRLNVAGGALGEGSAIQGPTSVTLEVESGVLGAIPIGDATLAGTAEAGGLVTLNELDATVGGGMFQVEPAQIHIRNGKLTIPEPIVASIDGFDLSLLSAGLGDSGVTAGGVISAALSVYQDAASNLPYQLAFRGGLQTQRLTLTSKNAEVSATIAETDFMIKGGSEVLLETVAPVKVPQLTIKGYSFSGQALVSVMGLLENPERVLQGAPPNLQLRSELALQDVSVSGRVEFVGVSGTFAGALSGGSYRFLSEDVSVQTVSIGDLSFENAGSSVEINDGKIESLKLNASFLGGRVSVEDVQGSITNVTFTIRMQGVDSRRLSALIPKFEGKIAGPLDGYLRLRYDGAIHIIAGEIALREGENGRFAYPDASELFGEEQDQMVMRRLQTSLEDLILKRFLVRLDPRDETQAPIRIFISGAGAKRGSIPVEIDLKLQGEITYILELLLGNKFTISFE